MTRQRIPFLVLVLALMAGAVQAQPRCDDLKFRIWRPSGNTWFNFGEPVQMEPGEKGDLYIHLRSQTDPYSTSANIGHAADYGFRGGYTDTSIFTFDKQSAEDRANGKLKIQAKGPGRFPVGYRITAAKGASAFERLPQACREGLVQIRVGRGGNTGGGTMGGNDSRGDGNPGSLSARRAAQQLSRGIHMDLMPWEDKQYVPQEVDDVLRRGRAALVDITASVLASRAFQDGAYHRVLDNNPDLVRRAGGTPRVGVVAEPLLADFHKRFFGSLRVTDNEYRNQMQALLSCLERPEGSGCRTLADALINHSNYAQHHRDEMNAVEGDRRR